MPMQVIVPDDRNKIIKAIQALEYLLKHDTNEKDKQYHIEAIERLKAALITPMVYSTHR